MIIGNGIILGQSGGQGLEQRSIEIVENGTTVVLPNEGYDGMSRVTIVTSVPMRSPHADPVADFDLAQWIEDGLSWEGSVTIEE